MNPITNKPTTNEKNAAKGVKLLKEVNKVKEEKIKQVPSKHIKSRKSLS